MLQKSHFGLQTGNNQLILKENLGIKKQIQQISAYNLKAKKFKNDSQKQEHIQKQSQKINEKNLKQAKIMIVDKSQQNRFYTKEQLYQKYSLSQYGFLQKQNCSQLPQKFKVFNKIFLFLTKDKSCSFGSLVRELPTYCPEEHCLNSLSLQEKKFMFALLACSLHVYIWENGENKSRKSIPQIIGVPLLQLSQQFGIFPSVSYAANILYNWFPKTDIQSMNPDDLRIMFNMSGTPSEEWFYLIIISIEGQGGIYLTDLFNAHLLKEMEMFQMLKKLLECLIQMKMTMKRMYEKNDPKIFNFKIRKFFSGMNHQNIGPDGILIEGTALRIKGHGGSGFQSTLIQVLNTFFQIKLQGKSLDFLKNMLQYMPTKHVMFLQDLQNKPKISQIIIGWHNKDLLKLYNDCIQTFTQFRQAHLGLIHAYVFAFSKKDHTQQIGSGGTDLQSLLKSVIDRTKKAKVQMPLRENSLNYTKKQILVVSLIVIFLFVGFFTMRTQNNFTMI